MKFVALSLVAFLAATEAFTLDSIANTRIINGEDAVPHSAPYIVSLGRGPKGSHFCGGSIIAKNWVLTAGHCVDQQTNIVITAGLHKLGELNKRTQQRVVDFVKRHESYKNFKNYDIALLHLAEPLEFTTYVQPAALPSLREISTGNATLYGWGKDKPMVNTLPKTLQTVHTRLINYEECLEELTENSQLVPTNICSDSLGEGISGCNGDSGGPLVIEVPGAPSQVVGIVSWGYVPCGEAGKPTVYTSVAPYISWIVKIMNAYYALQ